MDRSSARSESAARPRHRTVSSPKPARTSWRRCYRASSSRETNPPRGVSKCWRFPMCDYSLAEVRNRLAVEGEELTVYRFPTGTLGFTSPEELQQQPELRGWRSWFSPRQVPCAVCIPPGAQLVLRDIPARLQSGLGVGDEEAAVFIQTGMDAGRHRD